MRELSRDGDQVVASVSLEEVRLLIGTLNEALNGAYAIPDDEWPDLVGQSPHAAARMLDALAGIVER